MSKAIRYSDMAGVCKWITQFYLPPTYEPYLPLLPAGKHHRPLAGGSLRPAPLSKPHLLHSARLRLVHIIHEGSLPTKSVHCQLLLNSNVSFLLSSAVSSRFMTDFSQFPIHTVLSNARYYQIYAVSSTISCNNSVLFQPQATLPIIFPLSRRKPARHKGATKLTANLDKNW